MSQPRTFYSAEHGAEATGYSVRHFRRLTEENDIAPIEIGRIYLWLHADIEAVNALPRARKKRYTHTAYARRG